LNANAVAKLMLKTDGAFNSDSSAGEMQLTERNSCQGKLELLAYSPFSQAKPTRDDRNITTFDS